jgi:hypothetical protein
VLIFLGDHLTPKTTKPGLHVHFSPLKNMVKGFYEIKECRQDFFQPYNEANSFFLTSSEH